MGADPPFRVAHRDGGKRIHWRSGNYWGLRKQCGRRRLVAGTGVAQALEPSVAKAIMNKLKRKKDQFLYGGPYCLILALGNYWLRPDGILATVQSCLTSSPKLSWIGAIAVFTPRVDFESPEARPKLTFAPNHRARFPLSGHFWDGVSGKATYHLP